MLEADGCLGPALEVCCQRHSAVNAIREPEDFERLVGDGGCQQMCGRQMDCGHACPRCGVCSAHLFNVLQTLNPICSRGISVFLSCCGSGP